MVCESYTTTFFGAACICSATDEDKIKAAEQKTDRISKSEPK